jgi:DNA (cytosine-5)-methyltransferase 1
MKLGSLFSGGGLGDFGFMAAGMEIAWQCEIDEYCQKILALRYPESKKYRDIKILKGAELEPVDIITGGFPCQPFSVAGQQMGKSDDRHLWPEMFRIIQECKPSWVVGENVSGFVDMALDDVLANLESAGYEVGTVIFPAHALGAWHRRERVWIVGYAEHLRWNATKERGSLDQGNDNSSARKKQTCESSGPGEQHEVVGNANKQGLQRRHGKELREHTDKRIAGASSTSNISNTTDTGIEGMRKRKESTNEDVSNSRCKYRKRNTEELGTIKTNRSSGILSIESGCERFRRYWQSEPAVGRVANGIADRVHRLKMLGNGQVPACTYVIGKMIMEIEQCNSAPTK